MVDGPDRPQLHGLLLLGHQQREEWLERPGDNNTVKLLSLRAKTSELELTCIVRNGDVGRRATRGAPVKRDVVETNVMVMAKHYARAYGDKVRIVTHFGVIPLPNTYHSHSTSHSLWCRWETF